jgi:glycosyltransferase involved in cell wall biosynthesis
MSVPLLISVVIPTFNRKETLLRCLGRLQEQTHTHAGVEVIVVDDGSIDGTKDAVERFAAGSGLAVVFLQEAHAGPAAARNAGARKARGTILAFTEDDVEPEPRWLEHAARYFQDPGTAALEGETRSVASGNLRSFESPGTHGFLPCNLFVRRDLFLEAGGFDPEYCDLRLGLYFREDADFGCRLLDRGHRVVFGPDVVVTHPAQFTTPGEVLRHARRYLFDPLLYRNHPDFYRKFIEVKRFGPISIHRPFHYLCWFYVLSLIAILLQVFFANYTYLLFSLILMLLLHSGIRFRYERKSVPPLWNVPLTLVFAGLPLYYLAWFTRGCLRFRSWGALL